MGGDSEVAVRGFNDLRGSSVFEGEARHVSNCSVVRATRAACVLWNVTTKNKLRSGSHEITLYSSCEQSN